MQPLIEWNAPEHFHTEKNNDWYWAVGIISITAISLSIIFKDIMFAILLAVSAFALIVHATKKPRIVNCQINDRGVIIDNVLYPFLNLESFWIDAEEHPPKILIKSYKTFMPYIKVYIEEVDPEQVRDILLNYIAETEHLEPISQKIFEKFGF